MKVSRLWSPGVSPLEMKRGMDKAVADIVEKLKSMAIACKDKKAIAQVAP